MDSPQNDGAPPRDVAYFPRKVRHLPKRNSTMPKVRFDKFFSHEILRRQIIVRATKQAQVGQGVLPAKRQRDHVIKL